MNSLKILALKSTIAILLLISCSAGCSTESVEPEPDTDYHQFTSYNDFISTLGAISTIEDETLRNDKQDRFWDSLKANHQIPFSMGDSVAMLYKSSTATSVAWAGDFTGWSPSWNGRKIDNLSIYKYETTLPADARLDYKIVVGNNWILDPNNEYIQHSGFGPNSELRMPDWVLAEETVRKEGTISGHLSENMLITSSNLGYTVQYKVYTPYTYDAESAMPVIYVTDGHEYADDLKGAMLIVLDNLIYSGSIKPIIAVFIDPRNPANLSENRRGDEYTANLNYANFVADELVKKIDDTYKTLAEPANRAVLGTSLGGWNSAYFGLKRSDKFELIGIHSPAFDDQIIADYSSSAKLPIKVFMSTGVIYDTQDQARRMKAILEAKDYPFEYIEVNQGHSWGNWKGMLKQPLTYFFGI